MNLRKFLESLGTGPLPSRLIGIVLYAVVIAAIYGLITLVRFYWDFLEL